MFDRIKEMKVEKKLKYCFSLVVIIASVASILGLVVLLRNNIKYNNALVSNGFSQGEIGIFSTYLNKEPAIVREMILHKDETELKDAQAELDALQKQTDEAMAVMKANCNTEEELKYIAIIDETLPVYREIFGQVEKLALENHDQEAFDLLLEQGKPTLKQLTNAVEDLIDLNVTMGNEVKSALTIQTYVLAGVMLLVIVVAILISMQFAGFVAKLLAEPISKVKDASARLASGDLSVVIEPMYPDEIGEMTEHFKDATITLSTYIKELERVLSEVAAGNFNVTAEISFRGDFRALNEAIDMITRSTRHLKKWHWGPARWRKAHRRWQKALPIRPVP